MTRSKTAVLGFGALLAHARDHDLRELVEVHRIQPGTPLDLGSYPLGSWFGSQEADVW